MWARRYFKGNSPHSCTAFKFVFFFLNPLYVLALLARFHFERTHTQCNRMDCLLYLMLNMPNTIRSDLLCLCRSHVFAPRHLLNRLQRFSELFLLGADVFRLHHGLVQVRAARSLALCYLYKLYVICMSRGFIWGPASC